MDIVNAELVLQNEVSVKFILNESAVIFFPASQQHRDIKSHGLSYEDDYLGNAVAGLLTAGRVEIRFHQRYSDERIRSIWQRLRATPELTAIARWNLFYQGREIRPGTAIWAAQARPAEVPNQQGVPAIHPMDRRP